MAVRGWKNENFKPIIDQIPRTLSHYFFVNPHAKLSGKHYTIKTMSDIWKKACKEVGEKITLYAGLKHSNCSQFLNEKGGTMSELQTVTDHKRLTSVLHYGKMETARRQEMIERKVIPLKKKTPHN